MDLTPKGRDEQNGAGDMPQYWVRRHDEYE
jgi:predicted dithiol-disulfide oxidoreductase (DUF899 family)